MTNSKITFGTLDNLYIHALDTSIFFIDKNGEKVPAFEYYASGDPTVDAACKKRLKEYMRIGRYIGMGYKTPHSKGRQIISEQEWAFLELDFDGNSAFSVAHDLHYADLRFLDLKDLVEDKLPEKWAGAIANFLVPRIRAYGPHMEEGHFPLLAIHHPTSPPPHLEIKEPTSISVKPASTADGAGTRIDDTPPHGTTNDASITGGNGLPTPPTTYEAEATPQGITKRGRKPDPKVAERNDKWIARARQLKPTLKETNSIAKKIQESQTLNPNGLGVDSVVRVIRDHI